MYITFHFIFLIKKFKNVSLSCMKKLIGLDFNGLMVDRIYLTSLPVRGIRPFEPHIFSSKYFSVALVDQYSVARREKTFLVSSTNLAASGEKYSFRHSK